MDSNASVGVLGVDIDGCMADFVGSCFLPVANDLFGTGFVPEDVTDWDFGVCLGLTPEQVAQVWTADELVLRYLYAHKFEMGLKLVEEAMASGREVAYITARGLPIPGIPGMDDYHYKQAVRLNTSEWFYDMPQASMIFAFDKIGIAKVLGCTEFVEDNAKTALRLAEEGIKVILPDWPYNQEAEHPLITRVGGWR